MAWTLGILLGGITLLWIAWNLTLDALWQPTDPVTMRRLLTLSGIKPGERLIDLGCGDGRFVVAAAKEFGAHATGVEIDPFRVLYAKAWIWLARLSDRAKVIRGNMYDVDVSDADVVILFLSATSNFRLQKRLREQLADGARVVSYYHPMWGWQPDLVGEARDGYPIYVYRMSEHLGKTSR
ncbi:methyltransferase domain-containing protein [Candidatus Bipolaricaulota bacterium]|jgi:SAM-dependent methyltransferase|nr:methyltransferase domain-containing protein [Candidatus Bipolaricaulota bacterium]TFH11351.1 MAG: methyltransferase domain-containing protein [Candidatus Atribacteria bacterium]